MSIDWSKAPESANKAGFTGPDNYLQFYRIPGMFGDYDYWSESNGWCGNNFPTCANRLFERPVKVEWDGQEGRMSKQSHTPGPWKWSESYKTEDGRETFSLVCEDYAYGILSCDGLGNSPQSLGPQGLADAKLIAASPDLLEALRAVIEYGSMTGADWVVEQAQAAIEKATT